MKTMLWTYTSKDMQNYYVNQTSLLLTRFWVHRKLFYFWSCKLND